MRLLINTSMQRFGGSVQVALSFIYECRRFGQHEFHVVVGPGVGAVLDAAQFPANFHFHEKAFGVMGLGKLRHVHGELSTIEDGVRPDCVVTTSGPAFWRSRAPHVIGFNRPLFIYPESPYVKELPFTKKARLAARRWLHCRYFRRDADALIVQTDDVNKRVRKLLGTDQVFTVTNSYNGWFDNPSECAPRLPEKSGKTFRFLTLTSYYPHKNLEIIPPLLKALRPEVRQRVEFVLPLTKEEFRTRIGRWIPPEVRLVGPVPPPDCPSLYAECDAMFLPTLAECFSASYPEAMKMRKPIITTNLGFARSICADAALYFEPCNAGSAAKQIIRLIDDMDLQATLCQLGERRLAAFDSPAQRAEKILSICERTMKRVGSGVVAA